MIDAGIYALGAADSGLSALCGARGYQTQAPPDQAQYPLWTYRFVGGSTKPTLNSSGVIRQRVEFNGLALDGITAAAIRSRILVLFDRWSQLLSDGTNVTDAWILNPGTDFEPGVDLIFRCMCEFYMLYTLPTS